MYTLRGKKEVDEHMHTCVIFVNVKLGLNI